MSEVHKRTASQMLQFAEDFMLRKGLWKGVPPIKNLNMGVWHIKNECGTTACIAGHMCMDPIWNSMGLKFAPDDMGRNYPTYQGHSNFEALQELFKLERHHIDYIFDLFQYKSDNSIDEVLEHVKHVRKVKANYENNN